MKDAIKLGFGKLDGLPMVIGVQDFDFMGGSLGMAAGEAIIKGLQTAVQKATPFILFAASSGADVSRWSGPTPLASSPAPINDCQVFGP